MKKLFFFILIILAGFYLFASPALGQTATNTAVFSGVLKSSCLLTDGPDYRVEKLSIFLKNENSPLTGYADEMVEAADNYNLDWRLVPAITGVESSFGKRIPYNSYNAYGWNNGDFRFNSWSESIWHVSKTLKERYINRGATTVFAISRIYAPPSSTWAGKVNYFMGKIENTPNFVLDL
jgi:hypothetical protein